MLTPVMQYGFAGFAVILAGIIVWLVRQFVKQNERLCSLLDRNNDVIEANTRAIEANTRAVLDVDERTRDELKLVRSLHDRLLARPCIAREEQP